MPGDTIGWGALRIGLGCWLLSILTGYASQAKVYLDPSVQQLLNYHQATGLIAFATLGIAILLRLLSRAKFHEQDGASLRGAYYAVLSVSLLLVVTSVYIGTQLVYSHGVSVKPYQELLQSTPDAPPPAAAPATVDSSKR